MNLKSKVKEILGEQRLSEAKGQVMHYVTSAQLAACKISKFRYDSNRLAVAFHLAEDDYHVFRGYYDLAYMSVNKERFLVHRLPLTAKDNRTTKIDIGYFDLITKEFNKVSESSAWCWQQGSRLRYSPLDQSKILFNDVYKDEYCTRIVELTTGVETRIDRPLYDVNPDLTWGLSLNYSRLQRKRPGYGYNYFKDETIGENAPVSDGIFLVDIKRNSSVLKYSLKDLAEAADLPSENEYYVNHVSISPDGSRYIFFLIYTRPGQKAWGTVLFLSDESLHVLEKDDRVSHYCWIGNDALMVTCHQDDGKEYYCLFDLNTGSKQIVQIPELTVDGHPNQMGKQFITDTYPLDRSLQKIRVFGLHDSNAVTIAELYHDYRMRGEKRCDLHPSVEANGEYIAVDTTFNKGRRSVLIFKQLGDV